MLRNPPSPPHISLFRSRSPGCLTLPTRLSPGIPLELIGGFTRAFGLSIFISLAGGMLLSSYGGQQGMGIAKLGFETCEKRFEVGRVKSPRQNNSLSNQLGRYLWMTKANLVRWWSPKAKPGRKNLLNERPLIPFSSEQQLDRCRHSRLITPRQDRRIGLVVDSCVWRRIGGSLQVISDVSQSTIVTARNGQKRHLS